MAESPVPDEMAFYESVAKDYMKLKGVADNEVEALYDETVVRDSSKLRLLAILKGDKRVGGDAKLNFVAHFEKFCKNVPGWSNCFEAVLELNRIYGKRTIEETVAEHKSSESSSFSESVVFWMSLTKQGPLFNVRQFLALRAQMQVNCYLHAAVLVEHYLVCLSSGLTDLRMVDVGLWERDQAINSADDLREFLSRKSGHAKDALKQLLGLNYMGIQRLYSDKVSDYETIYETLKKRPVLLNYMEVFPELFIANKISYSIEDRNLSDVRLAHHSMVVIGARRDSGPRDGGFYFLCQTSWKSKFFIEFSAEYLRSCDALLVDVPDGETSSVRQQSLNSVCFLSEYAESAIDISDEGPASGYVDEGTAKEAKEENPFTSFYGQLLHQGNMLSDYVRTGTYQKAIYNNAVDFKDKVVLDVGTGTGILAYFAIQAGAKMVYAIDASDSVHVARALAKANNYEQYITIIQGKVEEVTLPEKVDVIISEPIGFLLVHERMLESYVIARDRFLKPGGLMMPTTGSIVLSPFSDDILHKEQLARVQLWENNNFYGLDLTAVLEQAHVEYFSQPIVGVVPVECLISSNRTIQAVDFSYVTAEELQNFDVSYSFVINKTAIMHGIAGWFDIGFNGTTEVVTLSTAPEQPATHWYQCRMLFRDPLAVNKGQTVSGVLKFVANNAFSYDVEMTASIDGTAVTTRSMIHLKDQQYSYLTATATASH